MLENKTDRRRSFVHIGSRTDMSRLTMSRNPERGQHRLGRYGYKQCGSCIHLKIRKSHQKSLRITFCCVHTDDCMAENCGRKLWRVYKHGGVGVLSPEVTEI